MTDRYFPYILTSWVYHLQAWAYLEHWLGSGIILVQTEAYCCTLLARKHPVIFTWSEQLRVILKCSIVLTEARLQAGTAGQALGAIKNHCSVQKPTLYKLFRAGIPYLFLQPFNASRPGFPVLLTPRTLSRQDMSN